MSNTSEIRPNAISVFPSRQFQPLVLREATHCNAQRIPRRTTGMYVWTRIFPMYGFEFWIFAAHFTITIQKQSEHKPILANW
jgi:hypothetical protein